MAYGKLGKIDEEICSYEESIILDNKVPVTFFNLGRAYEEKGCLLRSIDAYSKAIVIKKDYVKAHFNLCMIYITLGDKEMAIKELAFIKDSDFYAFNKLSLTIEKMY